MATIEVNELTAELFKALQIAGDLKDKQKSIELIVKEAIEGRNYITSDSYCDYPAMQNLREALHALGYETIVDYEHIKVVEDART